MCDFMETGIRHRMCIFFQGDAGLSLRCGEAMARRKRKSHCSFGEVCRVARRWDSWIIVVYRPAALVYPRAAGRFDPVSALFVDLGDSGLEGVDDPVLEGVDDPVIGSTRVRGSRGGCGRRRRLRLRLVVKVPFSL